MVRINIVDLCLINNTNHSFIIINKALNQALLGWGSSKYIIVALYGKTGTKNNVLFVALKSGIVIRETLESIRVNSEGLMWLLVIVG